MVFEGATGVGLLDRAIIESLHCLQGSANGPAVRAAALLADLDSQGIPPRLAYEHLCVSTQRALCWVRAYRPTGNAGSRVDPPAGPGYVEMSLSEVGRLLADAPDLSAFPVGFINGNLHLDGLRPAFDPARVLDAVAMAASSTRVPDSELVEVVGPPSFPSGCTVEGDVGALHAGEPVTLTLSARLAPSPTGASLELSGLPPDVDPHHVVQSLADRATPRHRPPGPPALEEKLIPLRDIDDRSTPDDELFVLTPRPQFTLEELRAAVSEVWGVTTHVRSQLPAATPSIVRHHASGIDVARSVERLRDALRRAEQRDHSGPVGPQPAGVNRARGR